MQSAFSPAGFFPHFQVDLEDRTDLIEMREEVSSLVINTMKEVEEYQDSFERYAYLWMDDLQESMKNFLIFGHPPTQEELDTLTHDTVPKTPPTLAQFQQQVDVPFAHRPPYHLSPPFPVKSRHRQGWYFTQGIPDLLEAEAGALLSLSPAWTI